MALPLAPIIYAVGGAAAGVVAGHVLRGGESSERQIAADAMLGALPVGLGLRGATQLASKGSKLRYFNRAAGDRFRDIPMYFTHPGSAMYIGPQMRAIASGIAAGHAVTHLSYRLFSDRNKKSMSRGGQHTASSRMARSKARKSMRGPSAQRPGKGRGKSTYFRRDEERY
jgi:hypothetical protein